MLERPIDTLKGVGPKRARALSERFGLRTLRDLVQIAPLGYREAPPEIGEEWREGEEVEVRAVVRGIHTRRGRRGVLVTRLDLEVGERRLDAQLFNQPWLHQRHRAGDGIALRGRLERAGKAWRLTRCSVQAEPGREVPGALLPRYPAVSGISARRLSRWIRDVALELPDELESAVPAELERRLELPTRAAALRMLHAPADAGEGARARRRLALEELCRLKRRVAGLARPAIPARALWIDEACEARIMKRIPFEPTGDQRRAMDAIRRDLGGVLPMARLVVGDVGTGKTAVAIYGILGAIAAGCQALLMAPTEALARQHHETLAAWLQSSRVRCAYLGGGLARAERDRVHRELSAGELDLVVGTHALIEIPTLPRAGLVVIDEQHRFGTRQKKALSERTPGAHYLSMSATPIPRSWLHALWGNLDITTLEERPPGRRPVQTRIVPARRLEALESWLADHLRAGGRGLWICPRVRRAAPEREAVRAATASVSGSLERLRGRLADLRIEPLHGRESYEHKAARIAAFREGRIDLLVATSMIEVGMDFPSATCMVVEDAARFGLVQLHQMRGRIGRGTRVAYAFFLAPDEGSERLEALERLDDGRLIAEEDLRERGPGALLGFRQHGRLRGRFFDWNRDLDLLKAVTDAGSLG